MADGICRNTITAGGRRLGTRHGEEFEIFYDAQQGRRFSLLVRWGENVAYSYVNEKL